MTKKAEALHDPCPTPLPDTGGPRYNFLPPPRLRRRVRTHPGDMPSMTRQDMKDDCDINRILKRFQLTGALSHFAKFSGTYMDVDPIDYQTAQNTIIKARQMFEALPSDVRKEVGTPEGFLAFVNDPKNKDRMAELGLRHPAKTDPPIRVEVVPPANPPADDKKPPA